MSEKIDRIEAAAKELIQALEDLADQGHQERLFAAGLACGVYIKLRRFSIDNGPPGHWVREALIAQEKEDREGGS